MRDVLLVVIAANLVLFVTLLVWCWFLYRRARTQVVRNLTLTFLLVLVALVLGSVQRFVLEAVDAGFLPGGLGQDAMLQGQVVISIVGLIFGAWGLVWLRHTIVRLDQGERMVNVLTERAETDVSVDEWNLTSRELEVLRLIAAGTKSDEEIGEALFIAPSTAATHVRNILRKSGLRSRNDLMLVGARLMEHHPS